MVDGLFDAPERRIEIGVAEGEGVVQVRHDGLAPHAEQADLHVVALAQAPPQLMRLADLHHKVEVARLRLEVGPGERAVGAHVDPAARGRGHCLLRRAPAGAG
jgi:hypothetical protein